MPSPQRTLALLQTVDAIRAQLAHGTLGINAEISAAQLDDTIKVGASTALTIPTVNARAITIGDHDTLPPQDLPALRIVDAAHAPKASMTIGEGRSYVSFTVRVFAHVSGRGQGGDDPTVLSNLERMGMTLCACVQSCLESRLPNASTTWIINTQTLDIIPLATAQLNQRAYLKKWDVVCVCEVKHRDSHGLGA